MNTAKRYFGGEIVRQSIFDYILNIFKRICDIF